MQHGSRQTDRGPSRNRTTVIIFVAIVLTGAAVAGTVSAVTGSTSDLPRHASSHVAVSPAQQLSSSVTTQVVRSIWPAFASAAAEDNFPGLLTVASRPVAEAMEARFVCGCQTWPSSYSSLEVTAPSEPTYPLSFFAEIDQPGNPTGPETQLAVFEKQGPKAHWMITYIAGYGGDSPTLDLPSLLNARAAADPPLPQDFSQLAEMFQSLRQSGQPPAGNPWDQSIYDSTHQPGDLANELIDSHQTDAAFGMIASVSYSVTSYSPSFGVDDGNVRCATLASRIVLRSAQGAYVEQPPTEGAFGSLLSPGDYSSVIEEGSLDVCLLRVGDNTTVKGEIGGLYNADGVPYP